MKQVLPDEIRLLIRAVNENSDGLWEKIAALSKIGPVKAVFRFNSSMCHGVRVSQMSGAFLEPCTLNPDGCPLALRKLVSFCETNVDFIKAMRVFGGSRLDVTVKMSGDSFLGVSLVET